jgi:D-hydroxyproline dehydrogenase subunit gamma
MHKEISVTVNRQTVMVPAGATAAVAITIAGEVCRTSVTGSPRGPLCGMGICYECRAVINGTIHCKSCQTVCQPGMDIQTQEW